MNNRREFLKKSALLTAGGFLMPTVVPASVFGKKAPSNRIAVAAIGCGRQMLNPNLPVPPELYYDFWLGSAFEAPYTENRVHSIKSLQWDPVKEDFVGDNAASALLDIPVREKYFKF
ncbi:MAG: twin-arginine translocation signal domain-containing protein [Tannerella sp.]|jgi:hypothetical protein|nr:twin-arginine translocation signal domain-containing protein [Tannerella sp.]